jgi:hypothetical protein
MSTVRGFFTLGPPEAWTPGEEPHPWGWLHAACIDDWQRHVFPAWDVREHFFEPGCWCTPWVDERGIIVHNAADGRERYEVHGAKRN